jgi:hypothetical protein
MGDVTSVQQAVDKARAKDKAKADANTAMLAELARLQAENARMKAAIASRAPHPSLKVSDKGGVSVYGLGRFPVTLYKEQWLKLLDIAETVRAYIVEHEGELSVKGQEKAS